MAASGGRDGDAIPGLEVDLPGLVASIDRRLTSLARPREDAATDPVATDPIAIAWSRR